ncbi:MAG TPA: hypothetical protein VFW50_42335 [Streptosporangiaceae bacterium]|nr:hypothetical protein [Streptosporangiaceae bacterium]
MDRLLWQAEKRLIPDAAAISLVTDAAVAARAARRAAEAARAAQAAARAGAGGLAAGPCRTRAPWTGAAARCEDLSADADADADAGRLLGRRAQEYHQAAVRYRELAARYGRLADGPR